MPVKTLKTIRVIEWDSDHRLAVKHPRDPEIYSDVYQVLEWIFRQAVLMRGHRVGFEKLEPKIRVHKYASIEEYVEAIFEAINQQERDRGARVKAAKELYDYHQEDEIESDQIDKFEVDIGTSGPAAATWGEFLTVERPKNLLRYGFERIFYPMISDWMRIAKVLKDKKIGDLKGLSADQISKLRRKLGGAGRYLVERDEGQLAFDFSRSPFVREVIFGTHAVFSPFFAPDNLEDPHTFPLARFISEKVGYMFRDDRSVNPVPGSLRLKLTGKVVRERLKGNKKLLAEFQDQLKANGLTNRSFYAYLKRHNGRIKPGISRYLPK